MYSVETGVEIPKPRKKHNFPYADMNVGDSFLATDVAIHVVCNYNKRMGDRLGMKFTAKKVDDGIRVWRLE
jgi:hypothetical protein